jgi:hypothetical protein
MRVCLVADAATDLGAPVIAEKNERPKPPEAAAHERGGGALHPLEDLGSPRGVQATEASPVAEYRAPLQCQHEEAQLSPEARRAGAQGRLDPRLDVLPSHSVQPSGARDDRGGERAKGAAPGWNRRSQRRRGHVANDREPPEGGARRCRGGRINRTPRGLLSRVPHGGANGSAAFSGRRVHRPNLRR